MKDKTREVLIALRDNKNISNYTPEEIDDALNDALTKGLEITDIVKMCERNECKNCKYYDEEIQSCMLSSSPAYWNIEDIIQNNK